MKGATMIQRLVLVGWCVLMLTGCSERQQAIWRQASDEYWTAKRLYNAQPKTITTCKPWCFLDYCEYQCTTY